MFVDHQMERMVTSLFSVTGAIFAFISTAMESLKMKLNKTVGSVILARSV